MKDFVDSSITTWCSSSRNRTALDVFAVFVVVLRCVRRSVIRKSVPAWCKCGICPQGTSSTHRLGWRCISPPPTFGSILSVGSFQFCWCIGLILKRSPGSLIISSGAPRIPREPLVLFLGLLPFIQKTYRASRLEFKTGRGGNFSTYIRGRRSSRSALRLAPGLSSALVVTRLPKDRKFGHRSF